MYKGKRPEGNMPVLTVIFLSEALSGAYWFILLLFRTFKVLKLKKKDTYYFHNHMLLS